MNQQILDKVLNCPRLPSLPSIAIEVIELCRNKDININQIAQTISNDPALSSKVLRTVNSSYYAMRQPVSTISHALVILGLNSVKTLALGFSLTTNLKGDEDNPHMMGLWQRSIYAAVGARTITSSVGLPQHEEAFFGGLLQDLGMLAMIQTLGDEYERVLDIAGDDHARLWRVEREEMDTDHMEIGAALAEKWKLPPMLCTPIRWHELPAEAPADVRTMIQAVHAGSAAAQALITAKPAMLDAYFTSVRDAFDIDRKNAEALLTDISASTIEIADLFEIKTGDVKDVQQVLADANETLLELTLQQQEDSAKLEIANRELQEQVNRDSLTGAANRGRFNEFIHDHFARTIQNHSPLSVLFVDADRFKSVNDTHGHMVGDKVLVTLANALMDNCPGEGLVARYGGEEFAIVLPGLARKDGARLAEQIRCAIAEQPIEADENLTLNVTVSMGVATEDGSGVFSSPEQLVKAADRAVYAAKAGGRNCVRVFAPKPVRKAG